MGRQYKRSSFMSHSVRTRVGGSSVCLALEQVLGIHPGENRQDSASQSSEQRVPHTKQRGPHFLNTSQVPPLFWLLPGSPACGSDARVQRKELGVTLDHTPHEGLKWNLNQGPLAAKPVCFLDQWGSMGAQARSREMSAEKGG